MKFTPLSLKLILISNGLCRHLVACSQINTLKYFLIQPFFLLLFSWRHFGVNLVFNFINCDFQMVFDLVFFKNKYDTNLVNLKTEIC